ncbi:hypothetical protein nbrc107696_23160 [Gordonia spumicola]|uniref:ESX-1 secretion-associated protein n=1 Tax=Gordonia spumicola TaxID=589161 RepID=A0A7I9V9X3_9ACTN|nr:hypothetical protein [Gordonia spumicola]GEE01870.1 hypothetical protein nbrc107696_23160 [Gordonia spumicola]
MRVDVDGLHRRAVRQAALADAADECVAELRAGGFGEWWRDGRSTDLNATVAAIADRLGGAASDVGEFTDGLRRRVGEIADADSVAERLVRR